MEANLNYKQKEVVFSALKTEEVDAVDGLTVPEGETAVWVSE
jgi:hypothetical protein